MGAWRTPKHVRPHMCYHAEFGCCTSKSVDVNSCTPKLVRAGGLPLGSGRVWPLHTRPIYHAEFDRCWENGNTYRDPPEILRASRPVFQARCSLNFVHIVRVVRLIVHFILCNWFCFITAFNIVTACAWHAWLKGYLSHLILSYLNQC